MSLAHELAIARDAARDAGAAIVRHYGHGAVAPELKTDGSPITVADRDANDIIVARLTEAFPDDGLLSEERADDGTRLDRERVWIVDPLDGTRDFVARTGDFAVHIGLAIGGTPVVGVVYKPVGDALYEAVAGEGAARTVGAGPRELVTAAGTADVAALRTGITRTAVDDRVRHFLAESGLGARTTHMGASIKYMAIASGDLDVSVTLNANETEWDTCAPEVILREAGARITDLTGAEFRYNQRDVKHRRGILASNGPRHAELLDLVRPFHDLGDA